ncbi:dihydroorotate dehydrogenase electron transfer subunit [Eoetvoesiella caeni]|uniref:Dihydroorotate oxidase B electron transfer subunit n=1 Tax=Eoetvoesiella caeni TaxID=645616 RepID=A0A366H3D5_9BURK|nr:dihydroorotate dehydrogenase electron transfer subunit [Eoetvoesiella caeni]MCI2810809.1 dihydroorotate dehydrogenase electron transfer subunit [Eoetvoesiella caeni]NYT56706.1 dihydroorotate dehydrogenase electron transfer subunit [Eoetvoesiella caeni]RBP35785.1 dihydroorotate oxidase B electron transfer subunit [Eoetvoesiella caeni]
MTDNACFHRNAENVASHRCEVVEHRWVNDRYKYIRLSAQSDLAGVTKPGQFYQLKCPVTDEQQPFLLRPMSVYGVGPEPGTIEFLYNVTGVGTAAMASLNVGDHMDIVGPLGNTFVLEPQYKRILVLARGVGLATMAPLLQYAAAAGIGITAIMSAREPKDLMREEFLRGAPAQVHCVYDSDGTSSVEAVEALVRRLLDQEHYDVVYTCGSHRLLMLLQRVLADYPQTRGEVAMEQRMACGMGVCLSCVRMFDIEGDKQFLRVCREGPVFSIRDVVGEVEFG